MENSLKILIVEDLDADADLLVRYLKNENIRFSFERVWLKEDYIKALKDFRPDLIISDHSLPAFNGIDAFHILKKENKDIPFILTTGTISEKLLTEYMKEGIDDYILKENLLRLPSSIENVINKKKIETLNRELSRSFEELKLAQEATERFKREILESMRYAKSVQSALLQEVEELKEFLPQSFVFYLPKQIVSGDFYWFKDFGEKAYVCVGDGTGHGIPGALITMMALNTLHSAFNFQKIHSPHLLLKFLDEDIDRKFSHKSKGKVINDSMDIAICEIDKKRMTLTVSGANSTVFIVRDQEIHQLKTDKYYIGSAVPDKAFESTIFPLKKNDTIYLSTDGYQDQFGGEKGKKFSSKRLNELLLSLSNEEFQDHEHIIQRTLFDWLQSEEQTDDICIMGVRI